MVQHGVTWRICFHHQTSQCDCIAAVIRIHRACHRLSVVLSSMDVTEIVSSPGHRCLIFSQSVRMLDLIQAMATLKFDS